MARPMTLWIAVADGEHARFVQPDANNALHSVDTIDSATAHLRSRDIGSDRPGRVVESGTTAHHAVEPRHDPHRLQKHRFAHFIAEQLNEASARGAFDELVLVAPAHALNEIRETLDAATAAKVVGTLEKDLVKTPDGELFPHVRDWVSPVRRVR